MSVAKLYLLTTHPLAFFAIHRRMASLTFDIQPYSDAHDHRPDQDASILILDTCSVPEWLRVLIYCKSLGWRPIILIAEPYKTIDEELRLVYLGAHAIVPITRFETELALAIDWVRDGRLWISRNALDEHLKRTRYLRDPRSTVDHPTVREEQVIALLTRGFSNKQISNSLGISERTVKFHVSNILRKNHIESRRDIALTFGPAAQQDFPGELRRTG